MTREQIREAAESNFGWDFVGAPEDQESRQWRKFGFIEGARFVLAHLCGVPRERLPLELYEYAEDEISRQEGGLL